MVGDKVLLTCYDGYGLDRGDPGKIENLERRLLCVDVKTGKIIWGKVQKSQGPEQDYQSFITQHGYASSTPTADGQTVYVFFGQTGVFAYSLAGDPVWKANVGDGIHNWGSAASPILYQNLLIVNASVESKSLVAMEKATGKVVWRARGINRSWSSPLVVDVPDGKQELVLSVEGKILGFDPSTGKKLWECGGIPDYICPSVVTDKGIVYATAGRKPMTVAVRAGGRGDVTQTHRLWQIGKASKVPTPVCHEGRLHWVDHSGIATCVNAQSGELIYSQRLTIGGGGDKVYASLVLGDGKLYCVTRQGGTIILAAGSQFKELARNDLGDDSIANATPAIDNGRLFLRSDRFLYCIGK